MINWYIVQTFSGFEHKVAETLKETIKTKGLEDKISSTKAIHLQVYQGRPAKGLGVDLKYLLQNNYLNEI